MLYCLFPVALWAPAWKGLYLWAPLALCFCLCFCHFPICVLISIRNKSEVSLSFLLTDSSFVYFFLIYISHSFDFIMLSCLFIAALRSLAVKGLASLLYYVLCFSCVFCHFPILCLGSDVILDCIYSLYSPSSLLPIILMSQCMRFPTMW